jgi:hypothetical protein
MYITAIHARGFRDLQDGRLDGLGRLVDLEGPSPTTTALGDAVELAFAALSEPALDRLLRRWDLIAEGETPEITGAPFPDQASWTDQSTARALVADPDKPNLRVDLTLSLDPPLYGLLRAESARDPRVGAALGQGGALTLAVGALFTRTFDTMALTLHEVRIGDESFPTREGERPHWMPRLLRALATRLRRHDATASDADTATAALDALLSQERHESARSWSAALSPDGPTLRVARGPGGAPILLGDGLPLRRHGARAQRDAALAAAVHLSGADVVWAESARPWLAAAVDGDASALEQVFRVHPGGTVVPTDAPPEPRRATRTLPTTLRETQG